MKIIIDSREQTPFQFHNYPCSTTTGTLHTGDYSIEGLTDSIAVERKSLADLSACMTSGRERFERELERMKDFDSAVVVVEEPLTSIQTGNYRSHLSPESFEQSILSMMVRYRVPFLFGHDRPYAEWLAFNCLRHFWNHHSPPGNKIAFIPFEKQLRACP